MTTMTKFIFCLCAGRSGSAYLGKLLQLNLPKDKTYFQMRNMNFGEDVPSISNLLAFNYNKEEGIKEFWEQKIERIRKKAEGYDYYVEINPMLLHAGFSYILKAFKPEELKLLVLTRDFFDTIHSYHKRFDLGKIENQWLWYLTPEYPINLVEFPRYKQFGMHGTRLWYLHEIYTRIEYYKQKFKKHKFFDVDLIELTYNAEHLKDVLKFIGYTPKKITLDKNRENVQTHGVLLSDQDRALINIMLKQVEWNKEEIAKKAIKNGVEL